MPHLRSLCIDTLKLLPTLNLNVAIDQFSFLQELIVRQLDNASDDVILSVIACAEQYKMMKFQSMNDDNLFLTIFQICCHMYKLESMTIEFASPHALFDSTMLEELAGTEKKNRRFECIYVSGSFAQFWLEK